MHFQTQYKLQMVQVGDLLKDWAAQAPCPLLANPMVLEIQFLGEIGKSDID